MGALAAFGYLHCWQHSFQARIRKEADEATQPAAGDRAASLSLDRNVERGQSHSVMNAIPKYIVDSFEAGAAGRLFLPAQRQVLSLGHGAGWWTSIKTTTAFLRDELTRFLFFLLSNRHRINFVHVASAWAAIASWEFPRAVSVQQTLDRWRSIFFFFFSLFLLWRLRSTRDGHSKQLGQNGSERQGERLNQRCWIDYSRLPTTLTSMKARDELARKQVTDHVHEHRTA